VFRDADHTGKGSQSQQEQHVASNKQALDDPKNCN
jgi:hypothetical protein